VFARHPDGVRYILSFLFYRLDFSRRQLMANEATGANQKQILANQRKVLANQRRIEGNQRKLDRLLRNQQKLDRILANQKKILSRLSGMSR
jgi:hypothetical protein